MTDTIELLEAIGSDASLRYASAIEMKGVLEQVQASAELAMAVEMGDGAPLRVELGIQGVPQSQQTNAPGYEGDEEEEADIPQPKQPQPPGGFPLPPKRDSSY